MKNLIFFTILVFGANNIQGQFKYDYVWLNGDVGFVEDPKNPLIHLGGINQLNFNNGELNITRDYRDSDFYLMNASISSSEGELLFYTNGCNVFQADGEIMENGSGLNPGIVYIGGHCPDNGSPVTNGALILPLPESDSIYYIFHKALELGDGINLGIYDATIYTTVVDMSANEGKGLVIEKNDTLLFDTLFNDLHAVKHANGVDWWVLTSDGNSNIYYKILLTKDGVAGIFEQSIGPSTDIDFIGMSCFSPDGNLFARYDPKEQVLLYDFDRETGGLSNLRRMQADTTYDHRWGYSIAFSQSSRFLYVGSIYQLYQFDLEAVDVQASRVFLAEYDGYLYLNTFPSDFGLTRLAPDCKIYMSSLSSTPMYHVINYPDRKGLACEFVQRGLELPAYNIAAIPNFPNYRLDTGYPVCDSTIQLVVSSQPVLPIREKVIAYPNPSAGHLTVELPRGMGAAGVFVLYNAIGQQVFVEKIAQGESRIGMDISGISNGLYFWEVRNSSGALGSGKLIVSKQ